jgi:hypothetical protein
MKDGIYSTSLKKTPDGKMNHIRLADEQSYKDFIQALEVGDQVDLFMEINSADNTLLQLAKVHKCIREIAKHTGNNFDDIKMVVKDKAGLVIKREISVLNTMDPGLKTKVYMDWKSFAKISRDDLGLAIQACIDLGDLVGINLR